MRRLHLLSGAAAFVIVPRLALASPSTIVTVRCDVSSLEEDAEDELAGRLRDHGVSTVDPSAIDVTYHERTRVAFTRLLDSAVVDFSSIAWITTKYHAERLLIADVHLISSSLPYGQFTVYNVRARSSYRAFDVASKQIVAAGSANGAGRGEDESSAQEEALKAALGATADHAARRLA